METTTNSIAACAANTPARGRFGIKNVTSGSCPNFKPNRHVAGMESAQSAIEFEVVRSKYQEDASHAKALEASDEGVRYRPVGAGIRIEDTSGTSEILITQIQSQQAEYDSFRLWPRGLAGIQRENPVPPDSYEYDSNLRRFYAGEEAKTLVKPASNDDFLRNAA